MEKQRREEPEKRRQKKEYQRRERFKRKKINACEKVEKSCDVLWLRRIEK